MLRGRNVLNQLLGQKKRVFYGNELEGTKFKRFITEIDGYDATGAVIRSSPPYAVKNVIIESKNLGAMKDIVLYDVSGLHIFFGSAKAYLENEGIDSSDAVLKDSTASKDKMDEWQTPYGIAELCKSMQDYYINDRFEVLKRRAEKTISEAKDFFDGILKKYEPFRMATC